MVVDSAVRGHVHHGPTFRTRGVLTFAHEYVLIFTIGPKGLFCIVIRKAKIRMKEELPIQQCRHDGLSPVFSARQRRLSIYLGSCGGPQTGWIPTGRTVGGIK